MENRVRPVLGHRAAPARSGGDPILGEGSRALVAGGVRGVDPAMRFHAALPRRFSTNQLQPPQGKSAAPRRRTSLQPPSSGVIVANDLQSPLGVSLLPSPLSSPSLGPADGFAATGFCVEPPKLRRSHSLTLLSSAGMPLATAARAEERADRREERPLSRASSGYFPSRPTTPPCTMWSPRPEEVRLGKRPVAIRSATPPPPSSRVLAAEALPETRVARPKREARLEAGCAGVKSQVLGDRQLLGAAGRRHTPKSFDAEVSVVPPPRRPHLKRTGANWTSTILGNAPPPPPPRPARSGSAPPALERCVSPASILDGPSIQWRKSKRGVDTPDREPVLRGRRHMTPTAAPRDDTTPSRFSRRMSSPFRPADTPGLLSLGM